MVNQTELKDQLPKDVKIAFKELRILHHLRNAGITKNFGYAGSYLFQIVFALIFHQKNWFSLLQSDKGTAFPGKNSVYRFLNFSKYAWRKFLLALSLDTMKKVCKLTSDKRITVFIVDDSMFERNRSKAVELLARCWDHAKNRYYKGFRMLTLGWSDGHTFLPVDFSLLSSSKTKINGITEQLDKRSIGYKRRLEALKPAPEVVSSMIDSALLQGMTASHVLMDSWFTQQALTQILVQKGLDVIGMLKSSKQTYLFHDRRLSLKELYFVATPVQGKNRNIIRSVQVQLPVGIPVKIVFVRHRSKKKAWLAILCTDCSLCDEEIIRIYGIRWDIEVFFKCTKSLLKLQKEFQGRSYDLLISHTTIVFSRYILLAWQHRKSTDDRSFGGMFLHFCDEVSTLDWATALQQLMELMVDIAKSSSKKVSCLIKSQLQQFISDLPSYIKACLPDLLWES
jgi:hypothetical protein